MALRDHMAMIRFLLSLAVAMAIVFLAVAALSVMADQHYHCYRSAASPDERSEGGPALTGLDEPVARGMAAGGAFDCYPTPATLWWRDHRPGSDEGPTETAARQSYHVAT